MSAKPARPAPLINGWREALIIVADLTQWTNAYLDAGDWEICHQGSIAPATAAYLGLPASVCGSEAVVRRRGANSGRVRLLCLDGLPEQPVIRSNGRPWETGGWFDLNARTDNLGAQFMRLQNRGWGGVADPIEWVFGGNTVTEWLAYGPDGVNWALIERLAPALPAEQQPGRLGAHFNATQIVTDSPAARAFYEDLLGFEVVIELVDQPVVAVHGQNVLGLPAELAARQRWNIAMLRAPGAAGGMVEIISLPGLSGRDFAAQANPPNRGIISLRFPVDDLNTLQSLLQDAQVEILNGPQQQRLEPDGPVNMLTVRGPCGARLDFMQML